jgi:hypothetical protein
MPISRKDYMREYQRKLYREEPERAKLMRSKKYSRERYGFSFEEADEFDIHCVQAGKIRELLEEIGDPEIALKICGKYLNLEELCQRQKLPYGTDASRVV